MAFEHSIDIAAPVERVWELVVDIERWPDITPTVTRIVREDDGPLELGSTARLKQPMQTERTWTVVALDAPRSFVWETTGRILTISGAHHLSEIAGGCRQRLVVEMTGRGSGVARVLMGRLVTRALSQENHGFKRAAEAG